jgi:hypothetical protein
VLYRRLINSFAGCPVALLGRDNDWRRQPLATVMCDIFAQRQKLLGRSLEWPCCRNPDWTDHQHGLADSGSGHRIDWRWQKRVVRKSGRPLCLWRCEWADLGAPGPSHQISATMTAGSPDPIRRGQLDPPTCRKYCIRHHANFRTVVWLL